VDKISGSTCGSAGLLTGRVHLTVISKTLIGADPWVPMSLRAGQLREDTRLPPKWTLEPTMSHHVEAGHWRPQGRFVRPLCGPHCPYAFAWWLSGGSSSRFQVSTWFGGGLDTFVDHRIHVMHMCRLLIRRASLPWIGDISDLWYLA
jgi:hypothetical protein